MVESSKGIALKEEMIRMVSQELPNADLGKDGGDEFLLAAPENLENSLPKVQQFVHNVKDMEFAVAERRN